MTTFYDLKEPKDHATLLRLNTLSTHLQNRMHAQGYISFAAFMQEALYHPTLGYYNSPTFTLGARGDFITAPTLNALFAQCFANQCKQILEEGAGDVLEIGAGTGHFAGDVLTALNKQGVLPNYYIYEPSPGLKQKQQVLLQQMYPEIFPVILWLDQLPQQFSGVVIANEVLDALPIHCFQIEENYIKERCVTFSKNAFNWQLTQPTTEEFFKKVTNLCKSYDLYPGYQSEINLGLNAFIQSIMHSLKQGVIFFVDYGYGQREYYHPERHQGSLTCFYQHQKNHHPLLLPGLQDITAHVNFTSVIEYATDYGGTLEGYASQSAFLMSCGLTQIAAQAERNLTEIEAFHLHNAIKLLTLPTEMGERVKVMAIGKNIETTNKHLLGFQLQNRSREL